MPHTGQQAGEKKHRKMVTVAAADKPSSATFLMCKAFRAHLSVYVCGRGWGSRRKRWGFSGIVLGSIPRRALWMFSSEFSLTGPWDLSLGLGVLYRHHHHLLTNPTGAAPYKPVYCGHITEPGGETLCCGDQGTHGQPRKGPATSVT